VRAPTCGLAGGHVTRGAVSCPPFTSSACSAPAQATGHVRERTGSWHAIHAIEYDCAMRPLRVLLPIVALVVSLGVVACGGSDTDEKNKYVDQVNAAQQKFADAVTKLNTGASSPAEAKQTFDQLDPLLSDVVSDLQAIDPPDEVKAEHEKLTTLIKDFQTDLKKNAADLGNGDISAAQKIATDASKLGTDFDQTIDDINSKLRG
jgi:Tfp pilus assembly protein PilP